MSSEKKVAEHRYAFNRGDNGGEWLELKTKIFHNGDDLEDGSPDPTGIFINQEIVLNSYSNAAAIMLHGIAITPHDLRKVADELEKAFEAAKNDLVKKVIEL